MSPVSMSTGEFAVGLLVLCVVLGCVSAAAAVIVRRRLGNLSGIPALLAWATIATACALAVHLVPLAAGVLSRWSVVAAAALVLVSTIVLVGREADPSDAPEQAEQGSTFAAAGAALALAAAAGAILAAALRLVDAPLSELDMLTWNLPQIATWIQDGDLWQIHESVPYWGHDNYPHNGDVLLLALLLPFENDFLARTLAYPFLALLGLAVYQLARETGARREPAAACSALVLAVPSVTLPALVNGMPDIVMAATFAVGLVFLVRHERSRARADLVVGGLALGIAFGTKWYGVTAVGATLVVWACARALRRPGMRRLTGEAALLAGLVALAGGFWLLRNLVLYGNPVYPAQVPPLFDAPADLVRERYGFTLVDYLGNPEAWRDDILPAFRAMFAVSGVLLVLGAVAGGTAALRSASSRAPIPVALLILAVVVASIYAITPYSALGTDGDPFNVEANTRYAVPALIAAAGAAGGLGLIGTAWSTGFVVLAVIGAVQGVIEADLAPASHTVAGAAAVLAGGLLVRHVRSWPSPPARGTVLACGAAVAVAGVVVAIALERRFNDVRYGFMDPALAAVERAPEGTRIALTGAADDSGPSPVFPAFGPRLDHSVEYIGEIEDGQLRPPATEREWRRLLDEGRYDLVLAGRGRGVVPGPPVVEWAARSGLAVVASSERFVVLRGPAAG